MAGGFSQTKKDEERVPVPARVRVEGRMFADPLAAQAHPVPPEQRVVQRAEQARRPEDVMATRDPRATGQAEAQRALSRAPEPLPVERAVPSVRGGGEVSARALEHAQAPPVRPQGLVGASREDIKRYARSKSIAAGEDVFTPERAANAPRRFR